MPSALIQVLHPRHKLDDFKKANWNKEWIETVQQIVRDELDRSYAKEAADNSDVEEVGSTVCIPLLTFNENTDVETHLACNSKIDKCIL